MYKEKRRQAPPHLLNHLTIDPYNYRFSFAQGDFNKKATANPFRLVLELYHPVWIVVNRCPEVIATIQ
jgi:hypothetical protein